MHIEDKCNHSVVNPLNLCPDMKDNPSLYYDSVPFALKVL